MCVLSQMDHHKCWFISEHTFTKVIHIHVKKKEIFAYSYNHVRRCENRKIKEDCTNFVIIILLYCAFVFVVYQVQNVFLC